MQPIPDALANQRLAFVRKTIVAHRPTTLVSQSVLVPEAPNSKSRGQENMISIVNLLCLFL